MNVVVKFVNNRKGYGLFARKDFKPGEVIFQEEPIVCCQFAWNQQYGYQACDHCLRPLEIAEENARRLTAKSDLVLPYPQCCETKKINIVECVACGVQYCSEECRVKAFEDYHRTICLQTKERMLTHPLEKLVETWKQLHYPPETCNIMLLVRILATIQQSNSPIATFHMFKQFSHRTVNEDADLAHKLVGPQFVEQIDILRSLVAQAMSSEDVEEWFTPDGFRSLLALIGTNGQGVGTSAIGIWARNCLNLPISNEEKDKIDKYIKQLYEDLEKESGTFLDNEGSALFTLQSFCNHSCTPNSQPNFKGNNYVMSLVALADIKAEEEITISYLDECTLDRSRHTRQNILAENYLFKCDCRKCLEQADEPDITSEEELTDSD